MRLLTITKAGLIVTGLLILAGFASPGLATQSPSEIIDGCGRSGPRIDHGQTGVGLQESILTVAVPETGTYFSVPAAPDEAPVPALFICHVESQSSIIIDATSGKEISRSVGEAAGVEVLDQIAASATVAPNIPQRPLPGSDLIPVTPPLTGDGGLKSSRPS